MANLLKLLCEMTALADGSPASYNAGGALLVLLHVDGQVDGGNGVGHGGGAGQLEHADVVLKGEAVVALVKHHGLKCYHYYNYYY